MPWTRPIRAAAAIDLKNRGNQRAMELAIVVKRERAEAPKLSQRKINAAW